MGSLFSRRSRKNSLQGRVSDEDRAILGLKLQQDELKKMVKRYQKDIDKNRELARSLLKEGRKERALLMLKRKKFIENTIDRIAKQMDQIERMITEIETAQLNHEVYERLKHGSEALKKLNQQISVEDVEKMMEDTREAAALQEEITSIISGQLTESDLDEVEKDFAQLIEEQLPEVPIEALPEKERIRVKEDEPIKKKSKQKVALEVN